MWKCQTWFIIQGRPWKASIRSKCCFKYSLIHLLCDARLHSKHRYSHLRKMIAYFSPITLLCHLLRRQKKREGGEISCLIVLEKLKYRTTEWMYFFCLLCCLSAKVYPQQEVLVFLGLEQQVYRAAWRKMRTFCPQVWFLLWNRSRIWWQNHLILIYIYISFWLLRKKKLSLQ